MKVLKWENKNKAKQNPVKGDLDWFARAGAYATYRVVNRWHGYDDYKIYYAIYESRFMSGDIEVQVESPKAGIRWCEAHFVLCR